MKNVLIYNRLEGNLRYPDEELLNYFRAQVDNSLRWGWQESDIIIGTNFHFEHKGVKNYPLEDVCYHNPFFNKFYGMSELMEKGILDDDFWFHDQDSWQVNEITFPDFPGAIAGCEYIFTEEWNTASMFIKKEGKDAIKYIRDVFEHNKNIKTPSDEDIIAFLRRNSDLQHLFTTISTKYNVGKTRMLDRYNSAEKPVCVIGVRPTDQDAVIEFTKLGLIDSDTKKIYDTYFG